MWLYWPMTLVLCLAMMADGAVQGADKFNLTEAEMRNCVRDNQPGECMHYTYCYTNHTMILNEVDENYLRNGECDGQLDWCCYYSEVVHPPPGPDRTNIKSGGCLLVKNDDCPWCAELYRIKGGHPLTQSKNRFYCAGALVGTRAVLTAASCVLGDKDNMMVHVNGQRLPLRAIYKHVHYRSGMPKYNVALLLLAEDILNSTGGACFSDSNTPPSLSECSAYGYGPDIYGNYFDTLPTRTRLSSVTENMCLPSMRGKASSVICPHIDDSDYCSYSFGSPIVCGGKVIGVMSNVGCRQSIHLATSLWDFNVQSWLTSTLEAQGVPKIDFYSSNM